MRKGKEQIRKKCSEQRIRISKHNFAERYEQEEKRKEESTKRKKRKARNWKYKSNMVMIGQ